MSTSVGPGTNWGVSTTEVASLKLLVNFWTTSFLKEDGILEQAIVAKCTCIERCYSGQALR